MFSQHRGRSALLSALVAVLLLVMVAGFSGVSIGRATTLSNNTAAVLAAAPICGFAATFNASDFPSPSALPKTGASTMYPLIPGTQFILEGVSNGGSGLVGHKVIFTVTDLTKMVDGVRTVVLWDRDFSLNLNTQEYELTEAELAFHALDNADNPWNLGEYPAQYPGGVFSDAGDTWISGLASLKGKAKAQGGWIIPGAPQVSATKFLQAYAPSIIGDCGRVAEVDRSHVCNTTTGLCYDHVLVIDEDSPGEPGIQQKYYAPGVGNFKVGAIDNDPQGETLELTQKLKLSREDCIAAREAALALEDQAYHHDNSQTVYQQSTPMEQTGQCETLSPTATPTTLPTATPIVGRGPGRNIYIPLTSKPFPTPTLPPAIFDGCKSDPNPASAPNSPIRIVAINKITEVVTLQNVSDKTVSLEDWNLCSINGNQEHDQIFGTIAAGQTRTFPNIGGGNIWNDTARDDAALYNSAGFLVSYYVDQ